jgi:hypothetical protein
MNFFKCGERVQLKYKNVAGYTFDFAKESGLVVGYATLQSGIPCVILSMDAKDSNGVRHDRLVVSMDAVEPLA